MTRTADSNTGITKLTADILATMGNDALRARRVALCKAGETIDTAELAESLRETCDELRARGFVEPKPGSADGDVMLRDGLIPPDYAASIVSQVLGADVTELNEALLERAIARRVADAGSITRLANTLADEGRTTYADLRDTADILVRMATQLRARLDSEERAFKGSTLF